MGGLRRAPHVEPVARWHDHHGVAFHRRDGQARQRRREANDDLAVGWGRVAVGPEVEQHVRTVVGEHERRVRFRRRERVGDDGPGLVVDDDELGGVLGGGPGGGHHERQPLAHVAHSVTGERRLGELRPADVRRHGDERQVGGGEDGDDPRELGGGRGVDGGEPGMRHRGADECGVQHAVDREVAGVARLALQEPFVPLDH